MKSWLLLFSLLLALSSCGEQQVYDVVIRHGQVYDGSGNASQQNDIGINKDTIAFIGDLSSVKGKKEIDAKGLAV
ncbi:MAG: D-aminoacylase, partial [Cyclobacteriaceae bacterium]|nr:D-aminoacylase [Cyclobacteriaceae bacterium]